MATITDNFNRTDADALGSSSEGWSWTEVSGDIDIASNQARGGASGSRARAEIDLDSTDHYAQILLGGIAENHGVVTRYSSAANTGYLMIRDGRMFRMTAGALTQLANEASAAIGSVIRLESNSDQHTGYDDGVTWIGPVTDATHSSFVRTGIYADNGVVLDDFEAGDLGGGGGGTVYDPTGGQLNDPIHGGPVPA